MNILLSTEEYEFLRALSVKRSRRARDRVLRLPILDTEECGGAGSPGQRIVVVPVTPLEAEWLNRITREQYGFITPAERRARLVLREKIHRALQEVGSSSERNPPTGATHARGVESAATERGGKPGVPGD